MRKGGFTFIESLLVLALLAVMAVIAFPNFTQSQVEVKVLQAENDLRSIGNALEAYCIDHGQYPPDGYNGIPEGTGFHYLNYLLTTPVAYLPHVDFVDPFFNYDDHDEELLEEMPWISGYRYINYAFIYQEILAHPEAFQRYENVYGSWALFSRGPDEIFNLGSNTLYDELGQLWLSSVPYDPTNGTISSGDIVYSHLDSLEDIGTTSVEKHFWQLQQ